MHKTMAAAAAAAAAGARRVRAQQQPKARAFSTPTQCRLALAAVVLHDVGRRLAGAAEGRARPAHSAHTRPKTSRSDATTRRAQKRGARARDRRLLSKNWPCKAGTYN